MFTLGFNFGKYLNSDLDPHPHWWIQNKSTVNVSHGCKKYFLQSFLIRAITNTSSYALTKEGFDIHLIRIRHHITVHESAMMREIQVNLHDFCLNTVVSHKLRYPLFYSHTRSESINSCERKRNQCPPSFWCRDSHCRQWQQGYSAPITSQAVLYIHTACWIFIRVNVNKINETNKMSCFHFFIAFLSSSFLSFCLSFFLLYCFCFLLQIIIKCYKILIL